jgi:hypothetical protein
MQSKIHSLDDGDFADSNSPILPVSDDWVSVDRGASNHVEFVALTSKPTMKRSIEDTIEMSNQVRSGNVSPCESSTSSIGSLSDEESAAVAQSVPATNKKPKISAGVISDDSSDDDDDDVGAGVAVPAVVVSGVTGLTQRSFPPDMAEHGSNRPSTSPHSSRTSSVSHYQKKYEPPTSKQMSKVELSLWRKQQRQQRNRLSAAASRQKQKARITELEQEIADYERKYAAVQAEIQRLQEKKLTKSIETVIGTDEGNTLNVDQDRTTESCIQGPTVPSQMSLLPISSSSSSSPPVVNLSLSNSPFKMISRQALSQELSFTPELFVYLVR